MTRTMVPFADLPLLVSPGRGPIAGRHLLEGAAFGLASLTVVVGESHPGQGVPLHRHDCEELIIVHAGRGTYIVGETTADAGAGEVVVIPAGVPHR
ncbi:MAG: cupin domain-containing protein [Thermomicrobiales bacterium]